jgi:hypothetical protein
VNLAYRNFPGSHGAILPSAYLAALRGIVRHGEAGHVSYLLGDYSRQGWWYFFPVALAVKTSLPELLLTHAGLMRKQTQRELLFLTLPIVLFLGAAMTSRVNIGLRHILMIYPFLAAAAGAGAVWILRAERGGRTVGPDDCRRPVSSRS